MTTATTTPMACITVSYGRVRGKAKQYPYFQTCRYVSHTKRDGTLVWVLHTALGMARRSFRLATADAQRIAEAEGSPFLPEVRQWKPIQTPAGAAAVTTV